MLFLTLHFTLTCSSQEYIFQYLFSLDRILHTLQKSWVSYVHRGINIFFNFTGPSEVPTSYPGFSTCNLFDIMVRKVVKVRWVFKCLSSFNRPSLVISYYFRIKKGRLVKQKYKQWNHFRIYHKLHPMSKFSYIFRKQRSFQSRNKLFF